MNAVVPLNPNSPSPGSQMQALVPTNIEQALRLADIMSQANLMPEHLRGKAGDCLLVVMQAQRWGMDAVSVAQCTSVVRGKLCYEGKLVAAVMYAMGAVDGRLRYEFFGEGQSRGVRVFGRPRGSHADSLGVGHHRSPSCGGAAVSTGADRGSAVVATLAGALWGSIQGVDQSLSSLLLMGIAVAVLGGLDSIGGAVLAGVLLGAFQGLASGYLDRLVGGGSRELVVAATLVLTILIRPHGLFGREDIQRI